MSEIWRNAKPFVLVLIFVVIILAAFSVVFVAAQNHNNEDISERLQKQGVPIISVSTVNRVPYEIEIGLRSQSEDNHLTVDDNWNMLLANREAVLAYRWGARLKTYKLVVYNSKEEIISSSHAYLYPQDLSQQTDQRESALDNADTLELIKIKLEPGDLTLDRLEVFNAGLPGTSGQVLLIEASAEDLNAANRSLPQFFESYFWILENLNAEYGTNIVMTHLRVKDSQSEILLDYVKDLEGGHSQWTLAKGVYSDWFPHPPSELYASPTPELIKVTDEGYPPPENPTPVPYP